LAAASEVNINGLSDLHFRYDPTQADYDLALTRALEPALHKAQSIAKVPWQNLVFIQEIRESGSSVRMVSTGLQMSSATWVIRYIAPENVTILKTITL
jgi:uncharacterized protein YggE